MKVLQKSKSETKVEIENLLPQDRNTSHEVKMLHRSIEKTAARNKSTKIKVCNAAITNYCSCKCNRQKVNAAMR